MSSHSSTLVAFVAAACVGAVLVYGTSAPATTQLISTVRPSVATTTNTATLATSARVPHVAGARAYNQVAAAMPSSFEETEAVTYINGAAAPTSKATPLLFLAPVVAIGALFAFLKRSVAQPQVDLETVAIAAHSGFKASPARRSMALKAEEATAEGVGELYEVDLPKPIGIGLGRGNDGCVYVARVPPGPQFEKFTVGDKVTKCSASFGPEVWEALNYGQVMFAIKTRNGNVFLELEKRGGDITIFEIKKNSRFKSERAGGNYGAGTALVQTQNYSSMKEAEAERESMWRTAVDKVKSKDYEDALVLFEEIIGLEPQNYIGDNFALTTDLFRISHYQMCCVYSLIGNQDAALESLRESMNAGFDDYKQIRSDPDLAALRELDEFDDLMARYDESFINAEALNALKGVFGGLFGGKK